MDNETQQIFIEQVRKLPSDIVEFLSDSNWDNDIDEIASLYNLSAEELSVFKREVILVLVGVIHPDALMESLKKEAGLQGSVLEALVLNVEKKIFVPVRSALIKFFENESSGSESPEPAPLEAGSEVKSQPQEEIETEKVLPINTPSQEPLIESKAETINSPFSAIIQPTAVRAWEKSPEVVPDNLPTEETAQSFLPNLTPKTTKVDDVPTPVVVVEPEGHPFEEKMKKVFTAGQQSMGDLTIEQAVGVEARKAPPIYHTDPYREPIE